MSWTRVFHPVHPALMAACPYVTGVVEICAAPSVHMVGNLLVNGDPEIGSQVECVFEDHHESGVSFTLVHWRPVDKLARRVVR